MTSTEETAANLGRQFLESVDKTHIGAAASKLFSASVGDIVMVLSRSPVHKHYSLADIEWMILPAVMAGQFYVVEAAHKEQGFRVPIAAVTWAFVSRDVDARLREGTGQRIRLRPDEWRSGDIGWLVDVIAEGKGLDAALQWLKNGPFKERPLNLMALDKRGAVGFSTLKTLMEDRAGGSDA